MTPDRYLNGDSPPQVAYSQIQKSATTVYEGDVHLSTSAPSVTQQQLPQSGVFATWLSEAKAYPQRFFVAQFLVGIIVASLILRAEPKGQADKPGKETEAQEHIRRGAHGLHTEARPFQEAVKRFDEFASGTLAPNEFKHMCAYRGWGEEIKETEGKVIYC